MQENNGYTVEQRNRVLRVPKRAHYDRETVHQIIDATWLLHVSIVTDGFPTTIPMLHARIGNQIILHGATSSRLMAYLRSGKPICVSAAIVDGLVMARSLFHHSMNYRSVVAFGSGHELNDPDERLAALKAISDKVMPGRWGDARAPSAKEMKATTVVAIEIESASAKIRTGGPNDEAEDYALPVWAGTIPIRSITMPAVPDEKLVENIKTPEYINAFVDQQNKQ